MLDKDEVLGLNDVQPDIEIDVDLGGPDAKGLALKSSASELTKTSESPDNTVLELPGTRLSLIASRVAPQTINYEQQANAYLTRFDADKNGYLDKSELPENVFQQVAAWDENEDGKIFADEMTASFARQAAPLTSQVVANVASLGNSLFQALDQTGDGRLSLREMRLASQQISALDKDGDKQISLREIPDTIHVTFSLGNAGYRYQAIARPGSTPAAQPAGANAGPEWFTRMDRNGDGDVTLKEFLGDAAEFKQLDTNADGFIEAKEAAEASK
jgi:Ca2+-binding EF-hand superfamily protein